MSILSTTILYHLCHPAFHTLAQQKRCLKLFLQAAPRANALCVWLSSFSVEAEIFARLVRVSPRGAALYSPVYRPRAAPSAPAALLFQYRSLKQRGQLLAVSVWDFPWFFALCRQIPVSKTQAHSSAPAQMPKLPRRSAARQTSLLRRKMNGHPFFTKHQPRTGPQRKPYMQC